MFDNEAGDEPEWVAKEREQFKSYRDKDGNGYLDKEEVRQPAVRLQYLFVCCFDIILTGFLIRHSPEIVVVSFLACQVCLTRSLMYV